MPWKFILGIIVGMLLMRKRQSQQSARKEWEADTARDDWANASKMIDEWMADHPHVHPNDDPDGRALQKRYNAACTAYRITHPNYRGGDPIGKYFQA